MYTKIYRKLNKSENYRPDKKAFDKVPHKRLLLKQKAHGICNDVIDWVEKWITYRIHRVIVDGEIYNEEQLK